MTEQGSNGPSRSRSYCSSIQASERYGRPSMSCCKVSRVACPCSSKYMEGTRRGGVDCTLTWPSLRLPSARLLAQHHIAWCILFESSPSIRMCRATAAVRLNLRGRPPMPEAGQTDHVISFRSDGLRCEKAYSSSRNVCIRQVMREHQILS
jgi:hypothetical protein